MSSQGTSLFHLQTPRSSANGGKQDHLLVWRSGPINVSLPPLR